MPGVYSFQHKGFMMELIHVLSRLMHRQKTTLRPSRRPIAWRAHPDRQCWSMVIGRQTKNLSPDGHFPAKVRHSRGIACIAQSYWCRLAP
jgi:hypothetical protein